MPNVIEISDLTLPALAPYAHLTEAQMRSKQFGQNLLIAESHRVIDHALDAGLSPVSFLMERRQLSGPAGKILARCGDVPVYVGDRALLSQLTGYALTRGVLCAMQRPPETVPADLLNRSRRIAVLEGISDAANVGAIFRSAAALNMDAVFLTPTCCDPFSRRAIRVSMGAVFQIPWARIGLASADWPEQGIELLKRAGFRMAALALDNRSIPLDDPRLKAADRLAFLLGTEGTGLLPETISRCDYTVKIPMAHGVDSLNVAVAGAVAFWEIGRR